jgi:hypothetical protein
MSTLSRNNGRCVDYDGCEGHSRMPAMGKGMVYEAEANRRGLTGGTISAWRRDARINSKEYFKRNPFFFTSFPHSSTHTASQLTRFFLLFMSTSNNPNSLIGLSPYNSEVNHQDIRFSTLAGAHQVASPAPNIPPALLMPPSTPQTDLHPSLKHGPRVPKYLNSGGLIDMRGLPVVHVSSQSKTYVKCEFPAEIYCEVKKHVVSSLFLFS